MIPSQIEDNLYYIELLTRKKIRNPIIGNHASVLRGHGYDFWDHKPYQMGEDTRKIDWNATARMGYPLLKNTHEEREFDVFVVADLSKSMKLATAATSKKEVLLYVTAALAFSALSDHMRIGFLGFSHDVDLEIPPKKGRGHLWELLNQIWDFEPPGHSRTRVLPVLQRLQQRLKRMSLILLVSDFVFEENLLDEMAFKQIAARNDLIPVLVEDPSESRLPSGSGYIRFRDLESGHEQIVRLSAANRLLYREGARRRKRDLIAGFYRHGLDFLEVTTKDPFRELVASLFLTRKRR